MLRKSFARNGHKVENSHISLNLELLPEAPPENKGWRRVLCTTGVKTTLRGLSLLGRAPTAASLAKRRAVENNILPLCRQLSNVSLQMKGTRAILSS